MTPPADRSESAAQDAPAPEGTASEGARSERAGSERTGSEEAGSEGSARETASSGDGTAGGSSRHDGLLSDIRQLRRVEEGRVLGGVCSGLGRQLQIDPVVLRVVLAVLALFGGVGIILYGAGWLLMPSADQGEESILERQLGRRRNGSPDNAIFVGGLIVLGLVAVSIPWWGLPWHVPALLVLSVLGLIALLRRRGERSDPVDHTERADLPGQAPPAAPTTGDWNPATAVTQPFATTGADAGASAAAMFGAGGTSDATSDTRPMITRPLDAGSAGNAPTDTRPLAAGPADPSGTGPDDSGAADTRPIDVEAAADQSDEPTGVTRPLATPAGTAQPATPSGSTLSDAAPPDTISIDPTQPVVQLGSWRNALPAPPAFWDQPDPLGLNAMPAPTDGHDAVPPPLPPPPPEPRRRPVWLFLTTMSAAAVVCGVLAGVEESSAPPGGAPAFDVPSAGFIAAALAVVGLGLIVGTWFGRSRALVAVGVILALALAPVSAMKEFHGRSADVVHRLTSVDQLRKSYDYDAGRIVLDLRKVPFREGQTVRSAIDLGTGDVTILVPRGVDVHTTTDVGVGDLRLFGHSSAGMGNSLEVTDMGPDGRGGGRLDLTIDLGVGEVEVSRG